MEGGNLKLSLQSIFKEPPVHPIIGFLHIQLKDHIPFLPLGFLHVVDNLLQKDGVIRCAPSRDEATLKRAYHVRQERPKSIDQDLGHRLIEHVAKANRAEVLKHRGVVNFSYEDHQSVGHWSTKLAKHKAIPNKTPNLISHLVPEHFVEDRLEFIRARGFVGFHTH